MKSFLKSNIKTELLWVHRYCCSTENEMCTYCVKLCMVKWRLPDIYQNTLWEINSLSKWPLVYKLSLASSAVMMLLQDGQFFAMISGNLSSHCVSHVFQRLLLWYSGNYQQETKTSRESIASLVTPCWVPHHQIPSPKHLRIVASWGGANLIYKI